MGGMVKVKLWYIRILESKSNHLIKIPCSVTDGAVTDVPEANLN